WLKFTTNEGDSGVIMVERMPRAVGDPKTQQELLEFYKDLETMTYQETNSEEKLVGSYRTTDQHAIIEFRVLPALGSKGSLKGEVLQNILSTLSSFFSVMSKDYCAPWYPSDRSEDRPTVMMCYT